MQSIYGISTIGRIYLDKLQLQVFNPERVVYRSISELRSLFFPKRYQSGLIKSIVYGCVCEDVPYGKVSRPWPMPGLQRARPAGPEHANF